MKWITSCASLLILTISLSGASSGQQGQCCDVSGEVVDQNYKAIVGTAVRLRRNGQETLNIAYTDRNGRYTVKFTGGRQVDVLYGDNEWLREAVKGVSGRKSHRITKVLIHSRQIAQLTNDQAASVLMALEYMNEHASVFGKDLDAYTELLREEILPEQFRPRLTRVKEAVAARREVRPSPKPDVQLANEEVLVTPISAREAVAGNFPSYRKLFLNPPSIPFDPSPQLKESGTVTFSEAGEFKFQFSSSARFNFQSLLRPADGTSVAAPIPYVDGWTFPFQMASNLPTCVYGQAVVDSQLTPSFTYQAQSASTHAFLLGGSEPSLSAFPLVINLSVPLGSSYGIYYDSFPITDKYRRPQFATFAPRIGMAYSIGDSSNYIFPNAESFYIFPNAQSFRPFVDVSVHSTDPLEGIKVNTPALKVIGADLFSITPGKEYFLEISGSLIDKNSILTVPENISGITVRFNNPDPEGKTLRAGIFVDSKVKPDKYTLLISTSAGVQTIPLIISQPPPEVSGEVRFIGEDPQPPRANSEADQEAEIGIDGKHLQNAKITPVDEASKWLKIQDEPTINPEGTSLRVKVIVLKGAPAGTYKLRVNNGNQEQSREVAIRVGMSP